MVKALSMASSRLWLNTVDPGTSETGVEKGNFWQNTVTNDIFFCHDATADNQIWKKYSQYSSLASFTPAITGSGTAGTGTYTTQVGKYSQVGSTIFGFIQLVWTATTGTGNTLITGLPASANAALAAIVNFQFENITLPVGGLMLNGKITGTQIAVFSPLTAAGAVALLLPAAGTLQASFFYST